MKAAAAKALEIDPRLSEARASLALAKHLYDRDWVSAEQEFKRAIELNPNYGPAHQWYGVSLASQERSNEAIAELKRALEAEPLSLTINAVLGKVFAQSGQPEKAIEQYQKTLEMERDFLLAHYYLGMAYEQMGRHDQAIAELKRVLTISPDFWDARGALGYTYAVAGKRAEAEAMLSDLKAQSERRYVPAYDIALIHAGSGQKDQAFEWLRKADDERFPWLVQLNVESRFQSLRSDPRFADLARRIGSPQ